MDSGRVTRRHAFQLELVQVGAIPSVGLDPSATLDELGLDGFNRAILGSWLRHKHPAISDDCLQSVRTLEDAFGWAEVGNSGGSHREPAILHPVTPEHYPALYAAGTRLATGHQWRFRGSTPRFADIADILHQGTLCHFLVSPNHSSEAQGYLALYNAQPTDGFAYFAFQRIGPGRPDIMYEGAYHFFNHCFRSFNLRKIYVEVSGFNIHQFASGLSKVFTVDAVIQDRDYYDGRYWPMTIAHLDRSQWSNVSTRWAHLWMSESTAHNVSSLHVESHVRR